MCVYAYVFAFLEEDKQSWLPQDRCCDCRDNNDGNNNISSRSPRPAARRSEDCTQLAGDLKSLTNDVNILLICDVQEKYPGSNVSEKTCENVRIRASVAVSKRHYVVLEREFKLCYEVIIQIIIA